MGRKRATPAKKPLFDEVLLREALANAGLKTHHTRAIYQWVLAHPDEPLGQIDLEKHQIPRKVREVLCDFAITTSEVVKKQESQIDHTVKLLVRLHDGKEVEAVIINHLGDPFKTDGSGKMGGQRATLCLSSQVGCSMGCTFCATGTLGLDGNLLAGEILEQMYHARRLVRPDIFNVVFMGMGEPLDNYDQVVGAVRGLTAPYLFAVPHRGVTVSTVGVVSKIEQLALDCPSVKLALSLHAPNQELRHSIVPSSKAFPLHKIMDAVDKYGAGKQSDGKRQGMVMIEYVMLKGINDQLKHAQELVDLLAGRPVVVNLIPFNPFPGMPYPYETPDAPTVNAYIAHLVKHDVRVFERRHHGRDIGAACGQLAKLEVEKRDIEALGDDNVLCCETDTKAGRIVLSKEQQQAGWLAPAVLAAACAGGLLAFALARRGVATAR